MAFKLASLKGQSNADKSLPLFATISMGKSAGKRRANRRGSLGMVFYTEKITNLISLKYKIVSFCECYRESVLIF